MREIKFRAWGKESKDIKIVRDIYFRAEVEPYVILIPFEKYLPLSSIVLMQYTGLKDKNGVEIYEGDIVEQLGKGVYEVRWEKRCAGFMLGKDNDWRWVKEGYEKDYEVLGNIYEHPELLNDKIKATIIDECGKS